MQPRSRDAGWVAAAGLAALLPLAACVTRTTPSGPPRVLTSPSAGTTITRNADGTVTRDASMELSVVPLPPLQGDGFHAPLLSPDGVRLVWQSRSNVDWPMLLAARGSSTAVKAAVTIREVEAGDGRDVGEDLLLGRMTTTEGVVVETPRPDGSRRVGLLPWDSNEPRWLPEAAEVRAFACVGPRGEWAYARRGLQSDGFDLVVERPEGRLEFPRREGESWMMPVVARDGIYACSLRDGVLDLAFLPLKPGEHLTRSQAEPALLRQRISLRATTRTAFQSLSAVRPDAATTPGGLLFFHPEFRRMAEWSPASERVRLFVEGSVTAVRHDDGSYLVSRPDALEMQEWPPEPGLPPLHLLPGLWIPCGRNGGGTLLAGPSGERWSLSRLHMTSKTRSAP